MSARGVRIVVGEGPSTRTGLLRFVLDGEGYDVVAEATTTADLARLMAIHRPDVVVLDDGIGATAVGMINEMSPNTKVVLVWPGAVMPVGGAARVEPSRVLQDLGPAIARLTGQAGAAAAGRGAALLDRVTNDPDKLHELLLGGRQAIEGPIIEDREPAPVVILPLTPTVDHSELILNVPDAEPDDDRTGAGAAAGATGLAAGAAALAGSTPAAATEGAAGAPAATSLAARRGAIGAQSALNRRLGNLALGGAAVASALVLALALGGARVPIAGVSGAALSPSTPPPVTTSTTPPPNGGLGPGAENITPPGGQSTPDDVTVAGPFPSVTLTGNEIPEPQGPPDVVVDPGDIGPGGGNDGPPGGGDGDDGGDDHSGGDSGDHDRGGGNDDPDNGGGDGGGGDDDGSDDHDSGGGNDGDGDDHDNGGGNDDEDNPAHDDGNDGPGGGGEGDEDDHESGDGAPEDAAAGPTDDAGSDRGESGETSPSEGH